MLGGEGGGRSRWGGGTIFLHLGGRRGGEGRWGARWGREEVTWGARRARRRLRRPTSSPPGGAGGRGGGALRWRRGGRQSQTPLLPPVGLHALAARGSCTGAASRGESKSRPEPSSAPTPALADSLPLPPSSGGRVGPGWGRHLTPVWGLPRRPPSCWSRGPRGHGPGGGPAALASSARQRPALRSPRVGLSGPGSPAVPGRWHPVWAGKQGVRTPARAPLGPSALSPRSTAGLRGPASSGKRAPRPFRSPPAGGLLRL